MARENLQRVDEIISQKVSEQIKSERLELQRLKNEGSSKDNQIKMLEDREEDLVKTRN